MYLTNMTSSNIENSRNELTSLIEQFKRTKAWFWRTGIAFLVASVVWLTMYSFMPKNANIVQSLALVAFGILMWILFLWAFSVSRKLKVITIKVKKLEEKLETMLN